MERKKRSQSFFGLHFDFHADPGRPECKTIGSRTTHQSLTAMLDAVRPDYVQCDGKGHPGWSSYPTRVGLAYPQIEGDPLRVWREATASRGVALYLHYSGVVDIQACRRHPEWARMTPERVSDPSVTSTFGPYVDELLIPQLSELATEYDIDGMWIDGECWGTQADFSPKALALYLKMTGEDMTLHPPVNQDDPSYNAYRNFCREQFRKYLRHYIDTLHHAHPDFQMASNWAFSTVMPEAVSADVDFISGDFSPQDAVNSARFEGRYLAAQGTPWDLMAWGFSMTNVQDSEFFPKSAAQLKQEAASVISLGGGFQCYLTQRKDGSIRQDQAESMAEVARFCRERQLYCHQAEMVPQVALLYSTADHYRVSDQLFQHDKTDSIQGMTQLFCEIQQSIEIRSEHNLTGCMGRWPIIVIPEIHYLEEDFRNELLDFARSGGSLLLAGPGAVGQFAAALGASLTACGDQQYLSLDGRQWASQKGPAAVMTPAGPYTGIGLRSSEQDGDGDCGEAAFVFLVGKGKIACLPMDLGSSYKSRKAPAIRALVRAITNELYQPMVCVEGSVFVDMTLLRKPGKLLLQLVNTAGPHDCPGWRCIDDIPPIGPLAISVTLPSAPRSVTLVPCGQTVQGIWEDGCYRFVIDRLELHEIAVIETDHGSPAD